MKLIYKYVLEIKDDIVIKMPKDSRILTVQIQNNKPCLWAECEVDNPYVERHFQLFGTGYTTGNKLLNYIGTFQLLNGTLVYHLFEVIKD